jgi:hypothetical protein
MSEWRKSAHSNPSGNCVEVAALVSMPGDGLDELRITYPDHTFWRGQHTGSFWAMPRSGGSLIERGNVAELVRALDDARGS